MCQSDAVTAPRPRACRTVTLACGLLAAVVCVGACGRSDPTGSAGATTSTSSAPSASTPGSTSPGSTSAGALRAPKTSVAEDRTYFDEITEADPALVAYEQKEGNVALRALLTDGSAFCALIRHDRGIDQALVDEADGVRSTESQTSLPLSVTTFNTIESVGLLALCPSELELVPAEVRSKIRRLGTSLTQRSG